MLIIYNYVGRVKYIVDLASGSDGSIYVADWNLIRKIPKNKKITKSILRMRLFVTSKLYRYVTVEYCYYNNIKCFVGIGFLIILSL